MAKNSFQPDAFITALTVGLASFAEGYRTVNVSFGLVTGAVGVIIVLACFDALRGG